MKNFKYLLLCLSVVVAISAMLAPAFSATTDGKLIKTYPLERYMYEKYDSQGFSGYTLVMAIKQPVPGARDVADANLETGHAFIRLAKSGDNAWTSYFSYNVDDVTETENTIAKVDIHKDAVNDFTVAKVFKISEQDANNVEAYLWENYKTMKEYDIGFNNCITFVLNAVKQAHIPDSSVGIAARKWVVPEHIKNNPLVTYYINLKTKEYFGFSAGDAAEDLKLTGGVIYYKDMP